jgi:autotransporter-associated beta strand protein
VAVIKSGNGTLTLSNANTYTGNTTVNSGILLVNGDQSAATGAVSVAATATLGGNGTLGGSTTIAGILSPGNSPGDLSFTDDLTLESTATLNLEITGIGLNEFDRLVGNGTNTFTFGGILAIDNTGYYGTASVGDTITVFGNWFDFDGTFTSITGTDLGGGLSWDTSNLGLDGTITVIPEPASPQVLTGVLLVCASLVRFRRAGHV